MELFVSSAPGCNLPLGCHVGIRVGDVLKQGRYEPQRCYHFPKFERRRNAKIDIYQHVGTCSVVVDPDAKSVHEVTVAQNDPTLPAMRLKVDIQADAAIADGAKPREQRAQVLKRSAEQYLTRHSVQERLSAAVKALLKLQPPDPTDFICKHLKGELVNGGGTQESFAKFDSRPTTETTARAKPEAAAQDQTVEQMRQKAKGIFEMAAADGSLEEAIEAAHKSKPTTGANKESEALVSARTKTLDILSKATEDGSLEVHLKEIAEARHAPSASASSSPSKKAPTARDMELKKTTKTALMNACLDGSLDAALDSKVVPRKKEETASGRPKESASADVHALRKKACDVLELASGNGNLEAVMEEVRQQRLAKEGGSPNRSPPKKDLDALRSSACKILMEASANGELEKKLAQVHGGPPGGAAGQEDIESVRKIAADVLGQALSDGSLADFLKETKSKQDPTEAEKRQKIEDVRKLTCNVLTEAVNDGSLTKALEENSKDTQEPQSKSVGAIRTEACDMLLEASDDGGLDELLAEMRAKKEAAKAA
jgi:hypothetical protein